MDEQDIELVLVEDDPEDVELTLMALKHEHIYNRVHVARDGEEALDYFLCRGPYADRDPNGRPKLVLLDLKLPKVDGLEVLRALRSEIRTRYLPVVVMTSSKLEEDMIKSYRLGVNSYIQKPVDFEQFQRVVRSLGYYWLIINENPPDSMFGADPDKE
jgi:two-component system, response regulator